MSKTFLDRAYALQSAADTRDLYDDWAASYEAEVAEAGYATPGRCAEALAAVADPAAPVLDFGCGTGLSGLALKLAGFTVIDGVDLSDEMLAQARAKGAYRELIQVEPDAPLPLQPESYGAIAAIGAISIGAAPPEMLGELMGALRPGGHFTFSFNDHTLEDPRFEGAVEALVAAGRARVLSKEHGPHLPARDLNSTVYVIEKT